jgi:hypothetical protein
VQLGNTRQLDCKVNSSGHGRNGNHGADPLTPLAQRAWLDTARVRSAQGAWLDTARVARGST